MHGDPNLNKLNFVNENNDKETYTYNEHGQIISVEKNGVSVDLAKLDPGWRKQNEREYQETRKLMSKVAVEQQAGYVDTETGKDTGDEVNVVLLNRFNEATKNDDGKTYTVYYKGNFYTTDLNYNMISVEDESGKSVAIKEFSPSWKAEFAATAAIFKFGKQNNSEYISQQPVDSKNQISQQIAKKQIADIDKQIDENERRSTSIKRINDRN